MRNVLPGLAVCSVVLMAGCASTDTALNNTQPDAVGVATHRGQFELNCPAATGEMISREAVQPVSFRFGVVRAEYTVGVSGCGKRVTYVVVCPENGSAPSCFASGGSGDVHYSQ